MTFNYQYLKVIISKDLFNIFAIVQILINIIQGEYISSKGFIKLQKKTVKYVQM